MRKYHALFDDDTEKFKGVVDEDGVVLETIAQIVDKLNDLEETRVSQRAKIVKYENKLEDFQLIIRGLKSYIKLEINEELW